MENVMQYIQCDTLKQEDRQMVYQEIELTDEEKISDRQGKLLNFLGSFLFLVVFATIFIGSLALIIQIPFPKNPFLFVCVIISMLILGSVALLLSISIGLFISSPLHKKAQEKLCIQKRIRFDNSIILLREYYGWTEPCIVTKCYYSSDKKFSNRDVCIFFVDEELRITANLRHGFSIKENDPGCYSFTLDEFSIKQIQGEKFLITKLESNNLVFHLGRRAKGFIENSFIYTKNEI